MEEVSVLVRALAKALGLDLKQGRMTDTKNKPPPGSICALIITFLVTVCGCQSEQSQYAASQALYVHSVDLLVAANDLGKIDSEDAAKITVLVQKGEEALNEWANNLILEKPTGGAIEVVNQVLDELILYCAKVKETDGRGSDITDTGPD